MPPPLPRTPQAALALLAASFIPVQIRGIPLAAWSVYAVIHLLFFLFGVRVTNTASQRLRSHVGLVFPNHTSVLDTLALYHCTPLRFLSASDLADRLVIGWIVKSLGTVFVTREDRESRKLARVQVADALKATPRPPVVLFPEGRLGPGYSLFPFRHGAFEIVTQGGSTLLPIAFIFSNLELGIWHRKEHLLKALWRLTSQPEQITIEVLLQKPQSTTPDDDPIALAEKVHEQLTAVLFPNPINPQPPTG